VAGFFFAGSPLDFFIKPSLQAGKLPALNTQGSGYPCLRSLHFTINGCKKECDCTAGAIQKKPEAIEPLSAAMRRKRQGHLPFTRPELLS